MPQARKKGQLFYGAVVATTVVLTLTAVCFASCEEGCAEGTCFKNDGQCVSFNVNTCYWETVSADSAVGGECTEYSPQEDVVWKSVDDCERECATSSPPSRADNCNGDETDRDSDPYKSYCKNQSSS